MLENLFHFVLTMHFLIQIPRSVTIPEFHWNIICLSDCWINGRGSGDMDADRSNIFSIARTRTTQF